MYLYNTKIIIIMTEYDNDCNENRVRANELMDDVINVDGKLIFDPYNPLNQEITQADIQTILSKHGLSSTNVNSLNLFKRAFVHRSYVRRPQYVNDSMNIQIAECPENCIPLKTKSNERLELLGDSFLGAVTIFYLYRRFPRESEKFITEKKIAIINNERIGQFAFDMGLHKWVIMSKYAEEQDIRTTIKKMGCIFEAFLGALILDQRDMDSDMDAIGKGMDIAQIFLSSIFEKYLDWDKLIHTNDNFKNTLQMKIQKEFKFTPQYAELGRTMDSGYRVGVYICTKKIEVVNLEDAIPISDIQSPTFEVLHSMQESAPDNHLFICLAEGTHKIKRKAEQIACQIALTILT